MAALFEKDIFSLSGNIISQIDKGDASYTYLHIRQDIQSMQKLIHVAFQAVRRNEAGTPLKQSNTEVSSSLESMLKFTGKPDKGKSPMH